MKIGTRKLEFWFNLCYLLAGSFSKYQNLHWKCTWVSNDIKVWKCFVNYCLHHFSPRKQHCEWEQSRVVGIISVVMILFFSGSSEHLKSLPFLGRFIQVTRSQRQTLNLLQQLSMQFLCSTRWAWCPAYGGINSGPPVLVTVGVDFITADHWTDHLALNKVGEGFLRWCPCDICQKLLELHPKYYCTRMTHQYQPMVRIRHLFQTGCGQEEKAQAR